MENSIFERLNSINVNEKIEEKNGMKYLSWAYAWSEVKKLYPTATYTIYETENGCIYHTDGRTCWVKTGVTIEGLEHIEYLPVMDYRNKSIPINSITSFDVNKAIQRSLTKAVARHGLGLYIYAGEDLPEPEKDSLAEIKTELNKLITKYSEVSNKPIADISKELAEIVKVPLKQISMEQSKMLLAYLKGKIAKRAEVNEMQ